jgi:hypothetical protein
MMRSFALHTPPLVTAIMEPMEHELVVDRDGRNSGQIEAPQADNETPLKREATKYCSANPSSVCLF